MSNKPKEFWICSGKVFLCKEDGRYMENAMNIKTVHVIEKSAYDELEKKYKKALEDQSHLATIGFMAGSDSMNVESNRECFSHHYACDCREAHFRELQAKADKLADMLERMQDLFERDNGRRFKPCDDLLKEYKGGE